MRLAFTTASFIGILVIGVAFADAQPGGGRKDKGPKGGGGSTETVDEFVKKLMAFNEAKDGKLTKKELTDKRLHVLFDRADTNKDGVVTRAELEALFAKESLPAFGGFGGPGGDGFKGKGGFGDKKGKGFKGGPQPGVVLPPFLQDVLELSDDQRKQVADLQKEVDRRLEQILTADRRARLRSFGGKGPKGPPPDKQ